jgi:hypothetical protein
MAGLFAPLSHWSLLAMALTPMPTPTGSLVQLGVLSAIYIVLPLLIGIMALRRTVKLTAR